MQWLLVSAFIVLLLLKVTCYPAITWFEVLLPVMFSLMWFFIALVIAVGALLIAGILAAAKGKDL